MLSFGKPAQTVLNDDDRAIDDQAEIERAQAHQVSRYAEDVHPDAGHQERDWNDQHGDQRGANIAQQEEQRDRHQQRALEEVSLDRGDGGVDEFRTVERRGDLHADRKGLLDGLQLFADRLGDGPAVLPDQHQGRTDHHLVAVNAGRAGSQLTANSDRGHVLNPDRNPAPCRDHSVGDLVDRADAGVGPNQIGLAAPFQEVGADREIGRFQSLGQLGERYAVGAELHQIGFNQIVLLESADRVDPGHAGYGPQLWTDDPVLNGPQIGAARDVVGEALALWRQEAAVRLPAGLAILDRRALPARVGEINGVHEDFAQSGRDRADLGLHAFGQIVLRLGEPFAHLLAGEIEIDVFLEDRRHLREPVPRDRACALQPRDAGQRRFHWEGHPLLDLDG